MADAEYVGSAMVAQWITSAGTVTLNTDYRSFSYNPSIEVIDATAGADTGRRRIKSFSDGQVTCSHLLQSGTAGTAVLYSLVVGTSGTIVYAPAGTASGNWKQTIPCFVVSNTFNSAYNDVTSCDTTWQQDGAASGTVY